MWSLGASKYLAELHSDPDDFHSQIPPAILLCYGGQFKTRDLFTIYYLIHTNFRATSQLLSNLL